MSHNCIFQIPILEREFFGYLDIVCDEIALVNKHYYQKILESELFTQFYELKKKEIIEDKFMKAACYYEHPQIVKYIIYRDYKTINKKVLKAALRWSLQYCLIEIINLLLNLNNELNLRIPVFNTSEYSTCILCRTGNLSVIKLYVDYRNKMNFPVDINDRVHNAFIESCKCGHLEVSKWFIDYGNKNGAIDINDNVNNAFVESCKYGHLEISKWLVDYGNKNDIHININDGFYLACNENRIETVKWIIEYANSIDFTINIHLKGMREILYEGHGNHGTVVFKLMVKYANSVDYFQHKCELEELFHFSCKNTVMDSAKWLIKYSNKINKSIDIHSCDELAFRYSCRGGSLNMVIWLIEYANEIDSPINIHAMNEEGFCNACGNNSDIAKWLIEYSNKINSPIDIHIDNEKPFYHACMKGEKYMVKWLVKYANEIKSPININIENNRILDKIYEVSMKPSIVINPGVDFYLGWIPWHFYLMKWLIKYGNKINSPVYYTPQKCRLFEEWIGRRCYD